MAHVNISRHDAANFFNNYIDKLLADLEVQRDSIIAQHYVGIKRKEPWMVLDNIYNICDWADVYYQEILKAFSDLAEEKTEEMIFDLFHLAGIQSYTACEQLDFDNRRETNPIVYRMKRNVIAASLEGEKWYFALRPSIDMALYDRAWCNLIIEQGKCDHLVLVFQQWKRLGSSNERYAINISSRRINRPWTFPIYFFDEFLLEFFGEIVLDEFKRSMENFTIRFRDKVGYKITELCSANAMSAFKEETEVELRAMDYRVLLSKELSNSQINKIKRNYCEENRIKMLFGSSDFAQCFITSEWLYKKYAFSPLLDNTYIVAGYLKSIEQMIFNIILIEGEGRRIRRKQTWNEPSTVEVSEENKEAIDSTLGSIIRFLNQNRDLFDINNHSIGKAISIIDEWRKKHRNGYFHKDNLSDENHIKEVRQQTLLIYFLLLGGIDFEEETVELLS